MKYEFIKNQEKKAIDDAISKFALEYGGSEFDIDSDLEETSLEYIRNNYNKLKTFESHLDEKYGKIGTKKRDDFEQKSKCFIKEETKDI